MIAVPAFLQMTFNPQLTLRRLHYLHFVSISLHFLSLTLLPLLSEPSDDAFILDSTHLLTSHFPQLWTWPCKWLYQLSQYPFICLTLMLSMSKLWNHQD